MTQNQNQIKVPYSKSSLRVALGWISPLLTFLLLGGIAWFLVWYWKGTGPSESSLNAIAKQALADSSPPPVGPRVRGPVGLTVPPLQVPGKGFCRTLYRDNRGASWGVFAKPYQMTVVQPQGSTAFTYSYSAQRDSIFGKDGPENALFDLANDLINNPMKRQHSGVAADVVQQINAQFDNGQALTWLPMNVADKDAKNVETLWTAYSNSNAATHTAIGSSMLDSLVVVGNNSVAQNKASFDAAMAKLRKIIPADKEQAYRDAILKSTAPPPGAHPAVTPPPAATPTAAPAPTTSPASQP